jgi:hypothetical protein
VPGDPIIMFDKAMAGIADPVIKSPAMRFTLFVKGN